MKKKGYARKAALAGAALSLGAPLGWAAVSKVALEAGAGAAVHDAVLYGYLGLATLAVFTVFGWRLGHQTELLETSIAELKHAQRELERASRTDQDTGLYNERAFSESLVHWTAAARRSNAPLSVVVWDLDQYRGIVEHHGRAAGREALVATAKMLAHAERTEDTLGRVGNEAFAAVLPNTGLEGAKVVAERLMHELRRNGFRFEGQRHHLTASAGYAELEPGDDARTLFSRAEVGLHQAKRIGGNAAVPAGARAPSRAQRAGHG